MKKRGEQESGGERRDIREEEVQGGKKVERRVQGSRTKVRGREVKGW